MAHADKPPRPSALPHSLAPRGLSRETAAEYIGVSTTLFDEMVRDGRMPKPKQINARRVWDRLKIDKAFSSLAGDDGEERDEWEVG